jgi:hypothetical protein
VTQIYNIGSRPTITAKFTDMDGVLTNPNSVVVMIRNPQGTEISVEPPDSALVNISSGVWQYTFSIPLNLPGNWVVRFKGTSGIVAASEITIPVKASAFDNP